MTLVAIGTFLALVSITACAPGGDATSKPNSEPTSASNTPSASASDEEVAAPVDIYPNKPAATDLTCAQAVSAGAAVPGAEDNNDEVYVTLIACTSVSEWGAAVVANPGVFAVASVPQSEVEFYTMIVCSGAEETTVCKDAAALGII